MPKSAYNLPALRHGLAAFGLHYFPRLRSTNDHAAAMRKQNRLYAPAVVLTSHQTAGHGRATNTWWSDASVMTVTFAFPADDHLPPGELPLIAGLAVRNAAAELTGNSDIGLKWPNDVLLEGRKLAGLLCERVNKLDLIGIGLNVNLNPAAAPAKLKRTLTSLAAIAGEPVDQTRALLVVASHLRQAILDRRRQPFGHFLAEYQKHHLLLGRRVAIAAETGSERIEGVVEGIDSHARLILRDVSKTHRVVAGHVILL